MRGTTVARQTSTMQKTSSPRREGTQALDRAVRLLRLVARRGRIGWHLTELAANAGIGASTAHRILAALTRQRLVQRMEGDRRYYPGPLLFELGASLPAMSVFVDRCKPALAEISRTVGAATMLSLRSDDDFVCVAKAGTDPNVTLAVEVGTRQPLVTSIAGIAMLLAMDRREAERLVRANFADMAAPDRKIAILRRLWRDCKARGESVFLGETLPGVHGFAVVLLDRAGLPFGGLSTLGPAAALPLERGQEILRYLRAKAVGLQEAYEGVSGAGSVRE